jgi:predicted DNA-binding protein with PD1-like motif
MTPLSPHLTSPRLQPGLEWIEKVAELCDQAGLPANASCYVDGSFKEHEQTVVEYLKSKPQNAKEQRKL